MYNLSAPPGGILWYTNTITNSSVFFFPPVQALVKKREELRLFLRYLGEGAATPANPPTTSTPPHHSLFPAFSLLLCALIVLDLCLSGLLQVKKSKKKTKQKIKHGPDVWPSISLHQSLCRSRTAASKDQSLFLLRYTDDTRNRFVKKKTCVFQVYNQTVGGSGLLFCLFFFLSGRCETKVSHKQ